MIGLDPGPYSLRELRWMWEGLVGWHPFAIAHGARPWEQFTRGQTLAPTMSLDRLGRHLCRAFSRA